MAQQLISTTFDVILSHSLPYDLIQQIAHAHGLVLVAGVSRETLESRANFHSEKLEQWQLEGFAGSMDYMNRKASMFTDLEHFLPEAQSLLSFLIPYQRTPSEQKLISLPLAAGFGRVARYAWGRDYHKVIPKRLKGFVSQLAKDSGLDEELRARVFTDAVPLLERAIAQESGLGFVGKNTMLIRAGFGSFGFLAEVVLNLPVAGEQKFAVKGGCGSCSRCLSACPTNAFVSERVLDAKRCISYLTIEKKGSFTEWERAALGEWVFGCDICQEVCPFNHGAQVEDIWESLDASQGPGASLNLKQVLGMRSNEVFVEAFAGTALMRPKRAGLLRNAAAVAANTNAHQCVSELVAGLSEDESALVRGEFREALKRLAQTADGIQGRRIRAALAK